MADGWKPDVKIAETYVRRGEKEFEVYSFERDSSYPGGGRFQETHVYEWDRVNRKRGEWIGQHHGHGIAFHCLVVASVAEHGQYHEEDNQSSYAKAQAVLSEAVRKAVVS